MSSNVPDDPLELRLRAALAPRRTTAEFLREVQAEIERAPASRERAPQDGTWLQRAAAGLPPLGATSWPGWKSALFVLGLPLLALLALLAALGWSLTRWRGLDASRATRAGLERSLAWWAGSAPVQLVCFMASVALMVVAPAHGVAILGGGLAVYLTHVARERSRLGIADRASVGLLCATALLLALPLLCGTALFAASAPARDALLRFGQPALVLAGLLCIALSLAAPTRAARRADAGVLPGILLVGALSLAAHSIHAWLDWAARLDEATRIQAALAGPPHADEDALPFATLRLAEPITRAGLAGDLQLLDRTLARELASGRPAALVVEAAARAGRLAPGVLEPHRDARIESLLLAREATLPDFVRGSVAFWAFLCSTQTSAAERARAAATIARSWPQPTEHSALPTAHTLVVALELLGQVELVDAARPVLHELLRALWHVDRTPLVDAGFLLGKDLPGVSAEYAAAALMTRLGEAPGIDRARWRASLEERVLAWSRIARPESAHAFVDAVMLRAATALLDRRFGAPSPDPLRFLATHDATIALVLLAVWAVVATLRAGRGVERGP